MNNSIECVTKIIKSILTALYQPFWAAIMISILFSLLYMLIKEYNISIKQLLIKWYRNFLNLRKFRITFIIYIYISLILCKTVLYRSIWANPLSNVMGGWGLYDADGNLTTEAIENLMLFIPFAVLLLWAFRKELLGDKPGLKKTLWVATKTVGIFSFVIEFSQLLFHLGTFQISDLVYNTLGGTIGGFAYYIIYKFRHRNG
jgi:glycopeptide antibiotics resistance protein